MRVATDILTYEPWRAVCDDCDWTGTNQSKLSAVLAEMNAHRAEAHQPVRPVRPAPCKPSEVLVRRQH